jgi:Na+/H+ antiporter NhaD/arsenite permease-like protein
MLIGQTLKLSFGGYLGTALIPTLGGLAAVWGVVAWRARRTWREPFAVPEHIPEIIEQPFNAWQTGKGLIILVVLIGAFLFAPWPREVFALGAAALFLASRRMASRDLLGLVDWHLLVLFMALFVINHALAASGQLGRLMGGLQQAGIDLSRPATLFGVTVGLSNLVSNVPAVMLLLPAAKTAGSWAGPLLALSSTLAGNLLLVGSIANLIVVEQAARLGVGLSWRDHARVGIPVTILTLALAGAWLWLLAA